MKPTLLVLAAGMGSRYGGLKQMDGLGPNGETIIDYSIFDAVEAGFGKVVYIVREYFKEQMEQVVKVYDINSGISSISLYEGEFGLYDYGDGVKSIQNILKKTGYYTGTVHSFFDVETETALKRFQEDHGLNNTGVFDESTKGVFAKLIYDDEQTFKNGQVDTVLALFN